MSFNQSRPDRSEAQYRKSGRSAGSDQQRTSSGSYGKGAGGGPAPSPSVNSSSSLPASNRSLKKTHNAQGSQSRVNVPAVNSSGSANNASAHRNVQNGAHSHPQFHVASDVPISGGVAKHVEPPAPHRSTRAVPKAPSSQSASMSLDSTTPATQAKAPGDPSKAFHFQFGSIGMQIPARTSSAPPNLDEQKRDQAHHDTYRSVPNIPTPSVPKQQLPMKDAGAPDQSSAREVHQVPKVKKDPQVSLPPTARQTQKASVLPIPMTSMQMPFHQPQVSVQFGGHNPQIQPQNVTATSHPIPMHMSMQLPMANAPQVQQHMFVPGLQPHPMQPQGLMHQGQGMGFTTQIGPPQLPPQLGNMGMGINPQYPQQQGGKFGSGTRKTVVKITHPDTHKEVKLDERADTYSDGGVSGSRSQSQQVPSFAPAHPINYYPNSYGASSIYYPVPGSLSLTSNQLTPNTQATRFNYTVGQGPQNLSFMNPNLNSLPVSKAGTPMPGVAEPPNTEQSRDTHNLVSSAPSGTVQVTVKPASRSVGEKTADSSLSDISPAVGKDETAKSSRPSGEAAASHPQRDSETVPEKSCRPIRPSSELSASKELAGATNQCAAVSSPVSTESVGSNSLPTAPSEESVDSVPITNVEGRRRESLSRSNSIKDQQKKMGKKGQIQTQQQVGGQSTTASSLSCRTAETCISSASGVSETTEAKTTNELLSAVDASTSEISETKAYSTKQSITFVSSEISGAGNGADILDTDCNAKSKLAEPSPPEFSGTETEVRGGEALPERFKQDINPSDISSQSANSKSPELVSQTDQKSVLKATAICNEVSILGTTEGGLGESARTATEADKLADSMDVSTSGIVDSTDVESSHGNKTSTVDALSSRSDVIQQQSALSGPEFPETIPKNEVQFRDNSGDGSVLLPGASPKDKPVVELNISKGPLAKGRKKRKEILQKADAAGTTSDLYMAYKGPGEKKETVPSESAESTPIVGNSKEALADALHVDAAAIEKSVQSKSEPDDWEDAADISTPKLEPSDCREQSPGMHHEEDGNVGKKYSRDFLLMFAALCTNLPEGFEIIETDIAEALMSDNNNVSHIVERGSYPSPRKVIDGQSGGSQSDRRASVIVDDDRWRRLTGQSSGRDLRLDVGYGANAGFRPGQGVNYGVLRNTRTQIPMQYHGGILPGPMQSMGPQGGMQRSSPDVDRWQRIATFQQRGLIPSPQTPLQMMHRADRKYEVGKVQDEEQAKQRQLKAILNKLTPQNFEKLFEQVKAVNIDNTVTLTGVISQIFDKALMEPTFCEMYANFCSYLAKELPDFSEDNEKITFKRLLLNKCQEEFERGEREQEEANKADNEGEIKQTEEEREEKRIKARRRMLGNIRLIGELYKKKMLTENIMHGCITQLLGQYENPDEEDVEALCKLMSTIGEMIDHPKAKERIDEYFDRMAKLSNNMKLSSRVRFMLKDAIELRKNKWQQRRKVEGPKKIDEVHRDAAQERQAQASRLARGPSMNSSTRRVPMDFGPRGLSSPTNQMGSFRGMPTQNRGGYGAQDARFEDRQSYEARTLSVSLPQRPRGGDSITSGPQGGLDRGMSIRGPPTMSSTLLPDISPGAGEPRRITTGFNGFSTSLERPAYGSREDIIPSYHPERFATPPAFDQLSSQERNTNYGNRDVRTPERSFDRPLATSARGQAPAVAQNVPSENMWPERLQDMSMAAIREFYSARDEKEVALCIKDLNSPGFHPSMVSLWVMDSFEKKDIERDLLAKLLVNLSKSRDGMLSQGQLIKGFESVLTTLEDAITDAPKAAEFLGRIFAKVVEENVIPLREIERLLGEGGDKGESRRLLEIGLAGDVRGSTLKNIKSDKGENNVT